MPRSEQIATEFALVGIMRWAKRHPEGTALDYGAGLGTVTAALRATDNDRFVIAVERSEAFYTNALHRLPGYLWSRDTETLREIADLDVAIAKFGPFGFVVIDDAADTHDLGTLAMKRLATRAVVLIEGNRPCERGAIVAMLHHVRRAHVVATWKPLDRSKGYSCVVCDPTLTERVWFLGVRLREGWLDMMARARGIKPGWRRRDHDPAA